MERFDMIPIYYDAEFTGLHRDTTLISVGLATEYGAHFYGEFTDYDKSQLEPWLEEHVIANLLLKDKPGDFVLATEASYHGPNGQSFQEVLCKGPRSAVGGLLKLWLEEQSKVNWNAKLQFYTDCYAYDWVLLNDLICVDGKAINLPEYISYIPVDLCTLLQAEGHDPDVSREEFAAGPRLDAVAQKDVFMGAYGKKYKHNSLWDAYVARECFNKL